MFPLFEFISFTFVIQGLICFSCVLNCRVELTFLVIIFAATPRFPPQTSNDRSPLCSSTKITPSVLSSASQHQHQHQHSIISIPEEARPSFFGISITFPSSKCKLSFRGLFTFPIEFLSTPNGKMFSLQLQTKKAK